MSETTYLDTETAYWVIPADDAFSVEVVTPWDDPTTVSPFATAADAKVWIAEHRRRVQSLCSIRLASAALVLWKREKLGSNPAAQFEPNQRQDRAQRD